jgi:hypothetical protein
MDLDVPLQAEVQSSQEVEKFVACHEAKRSLAPGGNGRPKPGAAKGEAPGKAEKPQPAAR